MCVQRICSVPPMQPYIWVLVKSCPITASVLLDADSLGVAVLHGSSVLLASNPKHCIHKLC